jgi:CRISPR-associated protein Cmr6
MGKSSKKRGVGGPSASRNRAQNHVASLGGLQEPHSKEAIPQKSEPIQSLIETYEKHYAESMEWLDQDPIEDIHASDHVPQAFRAQCEQRSQLQRIVRDPPNGIQDSQRFVLEWTGESVKSQGAWSRPQAAPYCTSNPFHAEGLSTIIEIQIDWRLLTNGGLDQDLICPVIGAGGWPFIPGSSIKGLFKRACSQAQARKWCGDGNGKKDTKPGCLRFHGAWPKDTSWTMGLLDLTHPQENWQLGFENGHEHRANAVISLLRPSLQVGISSQKALEAEDWEEITNILSNSLRLGLGGRTAAGYGVVWQPKRASAPQKKRVLLSLDLRGQGPASKLLDRSPEIRPTMFRAAIRGMALRLFAGIVDEHSAQTAVRDLFGGFNPKSKPTVGLLATHFAHRSAPKIGRFGEGKNEQDVYVCAGQLTWSLAPGQRSEALAPEASRRLSDLLSHLHALVMALGGFGRSWRRPDHRIFMASYRTRPIGCHWEWGQPSNMEPWIPRDAKQLGDLIEAAGQSAFYWLHPNVGRTQQRHEQVWRQHTAPWREVIHPHRMVVWCRPVETPESAQAIQWTHAPRPGEQREPGLNLSGTSLKGRLGEVGRLWIRMVPLQIGMLDEGEERDAMTFVDGAPSRQGNDVQLGGLWPGPFLEVVTCFPGQTPQQRDSAQIKFLSCMRQGATADPPFQQAWGVMPK